MSRQKSLAEHERHIGRTMRVLFEKGTRDGLSMGLTDNFVRVAVPAGDELAGSMREVLITGATDGMAFGRLVPAFHPSTAVSVL